MFRKLFCVMVGFLVVTAAATAQAALVAYEGFNSYSSGSNLFGQNGGTGWNGAWVDKSSTENEDGDPITWNYTWVAGGSGLSYPNLVATPGSGAANVFQEGGDTLYFTAERYLAAPQSSGTLFISYLQYFSVNEAGKGPDFVDIMGTGSRYARVITAWGSSYRWCLHAFDTGQSQVNNFAPAAQAGETHLVVLRIDFNASSINERIKVYLDPTLTSEEANTANATISNRDIGSVSGFKIVMRGNDLANSHSFDEIRFGTTWEDVVPAVPEPSTLVLLGCGLAGLVSYVWRWRR